MGTSDLSRPILSHLIGSSKGITFERKGDEEAVQANELDRDQGDNGAPEGWWHGSSVN